MKDLCILIVNYNSCNYTLDLVKSLRQNYKYKIVVFDNNSNEDLSELKKINNLNLIKNDKNLGLTGGVNKALLSINNKYVLLLNPDIEIDKEAPNELLKIIERDRNIAFVGGAIYNIKERNKINAFGGKINFFTGIAKPLTKESDIRELNYGEYIDACVLMLDKEIFQKLGGYDEKYFMYVETEDIIFRAMLNGYKVFINPRAKIWHKVYGSSGGKKSQFSIYYLTRNRFLFMNKHLNKFRYFLFLAINLIVILPLQFLLFIFKWQFNLIRYFLKGIYDGILRNENTLFK